MNNASMAEVMLAQSKGKQIEKKSEDGYWDNYSGTDFDFTNEYRVKNLKIWEPILEKLQYIHMVLTTHNAKEIQSGIMLGLILGLIMYELIHGAPFHTGVE